MKKLLKKLEWWFDIYIAYFLYNDRKKQSNTIYTINALNEVVKSKTGGQVDNSYMIDWEEFRNCILTTSNIGYKKIPTKVFKSFNTEENLEY